MRLGCTVCKNELMICGTWYQWVQSWKEHSLVSISTHTGPRLWEPFLSPNWQDMSFAGWPLISAHPYPCLWNSSVWNVVKFHFRKVQVSPRQQPSQATVEIPSLWHLLRETDRPHATRGNRSPLWATNDSSNLLSARRPTATDQAKQTITIRWE